MEMEIWQIRERAFHAGEQVVLARFRNISDFHTALEMSKAANPEEHFKQLRKQMIDDVTVEREMTAEERKEKIRQHNLNVFNSFPHA